MSDPRRLLDELRELTAAERRALLAGRDVAPPDGFATAAWKSLSANLASTSLKAAASAKASVGAATVKAFLLGALLSGTVVGARALWPVHAPSPTSRAQHAPTPKEALPAPAASSSEAPRARSPSAHQPASVDESLGPLDEYRGARPQPAAAMPLRTPAGRDAIRPLDGRAAIRPLDGRAAIRPLDGRAAIRPSTERDTRTLEPESAGAKERPATTAADPREESRLVSAGREALRSGAVAEALAMLDQARARFPNGTLTQERDALAIEALGRSGQRALAVARARAFLRNYPGSPYAARVQAMTTDFDETR